METRVKSFFPILFHFVQLIVVYLNIPFFFLYLKTETFTFKHVALAPKNSMDKILLCTTLEYHLLKELPLIKIHLEMQVTKYKDLLNCLAKRT